MLLASSLEPTGPKSTNHYLILHHNDQHELVLLPKSYSDLEKVVQRLYHLTAEQFHVESKELNICAGERVRIPKDVWGDLAELLGNVYIVQRAIDPSPLITSDALYRQIVTCNPQDATHVSKILENIRNGATTSALTTGVKWHGQAIPNRLWTGIQWDDNPRSIYAVRFTLPEPTSKHSDIHIIFGPTACHSLRARAYSIPTGKTLVFITYRGKDGSGNMKEVMRHTPDLAYPEALHSAGEHTIAFINEGDKMSVSFDFRESVVLPEMAFLAMVERMPEDVWIDVYDNCTVVVDMYKFA